MKERFLKIILFSVCALMMLLTTGCGARYMVKGQVVDAENGNPIKGAAIVVNWIGHKFGPPYASGAYSIEVAEDLSDENGTFRIPKYISRHHYMGVYKKGYVCWDSKNIILKGITDDYKKRKGFNIKNGMVIKLEPFTEEYSHDKHAHFTHGVARRCESPYDGIFSKAIESETLLHNKLLRGE